MSNIGKIIDEIHDKINTNVVIQVQSYGRVFIWDQLGKIVDEENAICVIRSDDNETTESLIMRGLGEFKRKLFLMMRL